ncbi:hypothetical protein Psuf_081450 [Phytohabitans suffuscus]|uniref:Uncharacterized protein n=1 Tax=Phytohabitans suffuscus TaxID=624315 RepID=A0A6F8YXK7_9ACTN|nr:hypothetical protein Psuf_081450 [Phytohabitans suffuscus]
MEPAKRASCTAEGTTTALAARVRPADDRFPPIWPPATWPKGSVPADRGREPPRAGAGSMLAGALAADRGMKPPSWGRIRTTIHRNHYGQTPDRVELAPAASPRSGARVRVCPQ